MSSSGSSVNTNVSAPQGPSNTSASRGRELPMGGQNIDKIMDFIEGNQLDEAKHAKKAAKKARQKQKKANSQRQREPSPPHMDRCKPPPAKLVPSLSQPTAEPTPAPHSSSRTILHPYRQSAQPSRQPSQQAPPPRHPQNSSPQLNGPAANMPRPQEPQSKPGAAGGVSSLSNILKGMDTAAKEKDKGSQMVTIRRVMDPNNAEPTVTITLKGDQPEKDKVLFKLVNGQGESSKLCACILCQGMVAVVDREIRKVGVEWEAAVIVVVVVVEVVEVVEVEEEEEEEEQEEEVEEVEEEAVMVVELLYTTTKGSSAKASSSSSSSSNSQNGRVSAVVYDGDDMAQSFNLPPGVTINRVEGQPGMVTISNNMGGAFSQPFLPNPNMYPSPIMHGFPTSQEPPLPKPYGRPHAPGFSWNTALDGGDPSTLNMTQKKKFKKKKKELQEKREREEQNQREEDDLMDQMYNLATGNVRESQGPPAASNGGQRGSGSSSSLSGKVAYVSQDIAHEARYAQYLKANANTLAKMSYTTHNGALVAGERPAYHCGSLHDDDKRTPTSSSSSGKRRKKNKKGNLEDLTTIDSVFTPKDVAEGEVDETEREVEAFKRFCFNNVPLNSGEKPKVNINIKDIMIKKRPCNEKPLSG
ncbi:Protein FAM193B [Portunus trituberculatus]|uniref:Protein FAM193B n=1 Tax=Portunus trituberculatus TaxID=210409 RepID=A0A5B7CZ20_PORTR|nr:Protein FAM193B [Portunus trituberculatus]